MPIKIRHLYEKIYRLDNDGGWKIKKKASKAFR